MGKLHEFDVALTPGIVSPASATRTPSTETHINVWRSGVKGGLSLVNIGTASVTTSTGITIVQATASSALANAPNELVLGDTMAAPAIHDLNQILAIDSVVDVKFTGFRIEE